MLRYAMSVGFIWLQELDVWCYALVFTLGAGYTLKHGGHVRVDIFYADLSPRGKALAYLFGTLVFLLHWVQVVELVSRPSVAASWPISQPWSRPGGERGLLLRKRGVPGFFL